MNTSVSLNALRTVLVDGGGGAGAGQQHQRLSQIHPVYESPSPMPASSSMENSPVDSSWNRNSVSHRYFQQGGSGGGTPATAATTTTTVWSPAAKQVAKHNHRYSNLFNSSGGSAFSSAGDKANRSENFFIRKIILESAVFTLLFFYFALF